MFSAETSVFISRESGIFTDKFYSDGTTVFEKTTDGSWVEYDLEISLDEDLFTDEIKEFLSSSKHYYDKQEMIEAMYRYDYFKKRNIFRRYQNRKYVEYVK
jgi:hypothetical protein